MFFVKLYSLDKNLDYTNSEILSRLDSKIPPRLISSLVDITINRDSLFAVRDYYIYINNTYILLREASKTK